MTKRLRTLPIKTYSNFFTQKVNRTSLSSSVDTHVNIYVSTAVFSCFLPSIPPVAAASVLDTGRVADHVPPHRRGGEVPEPLQRGAPGTGGHGGVAKDEISCGKGSQRTSILVIGYLG